MTGAMPDRAPCPVSEASTDHLESADDYRAVVVRLNARWRVIECRAGIQWILQDGKSSEHGTISKAFPSGRWT